MKIKMANTLCFYPFDYFCRVQRPQFFHILGVYFNNFDKKTFYIFA